MLTSVDISVGDIHATDISYAPVDYGYLTVVAPVDVGGKLWECYLHERLYVDAGLFHLSEERFLDVKAADMVVDYPYPHSLAGFFYQNILYAVAYLIVLYDVVLQVDVFIGILQVGNESLEFVVTVGVYVN